LCINNQDTIWCKLGRFMVFTFIGGEN
jgi:hypothetical protein